MPLLNDSIPKFVKLKENKTYPHSYYFMFSMKNKADPSNINIT